jgi:hypothetical protein
MLAQGIVLAQMPNSIGLGLRATRRFQPGELVWREEGVTRARFRTWREVCDIPQPYRAIYKHFMYQIGPDSFESASEFDDLPREEWYTVRPSDTGLFMNHSCDPTCWYTHPDMLEMSARRVILEGDWVTYDYAMSECVDDQPFGCQCGSASCRGRITRTDWRIPALRTAYWGHVARHVQDLRESLCRCYRGIR